MNSVRMLKKINEYQAAPSQSNRDQLFLTCGQLAEILGMCIHTVRKWRQYEEIPCRKFGRSVRFTLDEVLVALEGKEK